MAYDARYRAECCGMEITLTAFGVTAPIPAPGPSAPSALSAPAHWLVDVWTCPGCGNRRPLRLIEAATELGEQAEADELGGDLANDRPGSSAPER